MCGSVPAGRSNKRKTDPALSVLLIYFALFILLFKLSPRILAITTDPDEVKNDPDNQGEICYVSSSKKRLTEKILVFSLEEVIVRAVGDYRGFVIFKALSVAFITVVNGLNFFVHFMTVVAIDFSLM